LPVHHFAIRASAWDRCAAIDGAAGPDRRFVIFVALAPAVAQAPNSANPDAQAVKERQLLPDHYFIRGLGTIPDTKSYVIEQALAARCALPSVAVCTW
jgi:hypothetical protein